MPQRLFVSETWSIDDWFLDLTRDQRYLFIYLWTNDHVNQAGVYRIPLRTMAFETKFTEEELRELLPSLSPKVEWMPQQSYIWVRNFIKHQAKSPKFLVAAAKCLTEIKNNGLVREVIDYNWKQHRISIPYQYAKDRVSISPDTDTVSDTVSVSEEEMGVVKGEEGTSPPSESESEESLSEGDREVILVWRSVKGFRMPDEEAAELVARLRTEFPEVDILEESKGWAARKLSEPLNRNSRPSSQIWNWMKKARDFALERRRSEQDKGQRVRKVHGREDFRGGW